MIELKPDVKNALQETLNEKQELTRNYQSFASHFDDPEISKLYRHFAEAEMLHASKLREILNSQQK